MHRPKVRRRALRTVLAIAVTLSSVAAAQAQDVTFKGKTVNILVGGTAGGGIDVGARLMARTIGRYLPGNPTVVAGLMPGAGGVRLLEHLVQAAPKDGTVVGAFASGPLLEPMVGGRKINYSMTDLVAIGALDKDVTFCATAASSPVKTIEDARQRTVTVGGTGAASATDTEPLVLNALLGTRFKVITGYLGTQETLVAIERGEVDGRCAFGWMSLNASKPAWLPEKKVNLIVQIGLAKHPKLPDMPLASDLVTDQADKQLFGLVAAPLALSRPYLAPPGTPAAIAAAIRKAFIDTTHDAEFRADFRKATAGEEPNPTEGAEMQRLIASMYATPKILQERLARILQGN
jgi:tripartite-type tricarboxylate transporter receptor subunit TctC